MSREQPRPALWLRTPNIPYSAAEVRDSLADAGITEEDLRNAPPWFANRNLNLRNFWSVTISGAGVGAIDGPTMLIPAYDPVAIALLGFGVVLAAGLAFAF